MGLYPFMVMGLLSQVAEIQLLALEQVQKMTEVDDDMVLSLFECLGAEDAGVGKRAVEVITTVLPPRPTQLTIALHVQHLPIPVSTSFKATNNITPNPTVPRLGSIPRRCGCKLSRNDIPPPHSHDRQYPRHRRPYDNERNSILHSHHRGVPFPANIILRHPKTPFLPHDPFPHR